VKRALTSVFAVGVALGVAAARRWPSPPGGGLDGMLNDMGYPEVDIVMRPGNSLVNLRDRGGLISTGHGPTLDEALTNAIIAGVAHA
jgi:hypothetical protein